MQGVVKTIFKVLGGTVVTICVGALATEFINLSMTSQQLRNDINVSLSNACESFNQESYLSTSLGNISDETGNIYISGNVYGTDGMTQQEKYKYFFGYTNSYSKYYDWLVSDETVKNKDESLSTMYNDLNLLRLGLEFRRTSSGNVGYRESRGDIVSGVSRVDSMYTPMNSGVPYVGTCDNGDRAYEAVQNIFRWNLAQMESQCNNLMVRNDSTDAHNSSYVMRNGWKVYASEARITSIEYMVFDTSDTSDRLKLYELVSVGESRYHNSTRNNKYVTIIKVGYEVPVGYVGITPFGKIYSYIMTRGMLNNDEGNYNYVVSTVSSEDRGDYIYYYNID